MFLLAGLVTLTEMKAKQEDIVKERERQIVTSKTGEAHLNVEEVGVKTKHCLTKQVIVFLYSYICIYLSEIAVDKSQLLAIKAHVKEHDNRVNISGF